MFFVRFSSIAAICGPGLLFLVLCGCSIQSNKGSGQSDSPSKTYSKKSVEERQAGVIAAAKPEISFFKNAVDTPLSPDNTSELLDEVGSNWFYGQGLGETAVTVGAIAVFPPYALWVVGNAAMQLSGEEPVEVSKMLPEDGGEIWRATYDGITSVPGRTTAALAGEEYRNKEVARERIEAVLEKNSKELEEEKNKKQKIQSYEKSWTGN